MSSLSEMDIISVFIDDEDLYKVWDLAHLIDETPIGDTLTTKIIMIKFRQEIELELLT